MSDNVLKKQFQKNDVERLRNLIKGKQGDRTTVGIGYNGEITEDHKEGDVWEQGGKTWTIRDGIKENVTKLDKFKKAAVPLFCPDCKQIMDKQLDPFYFKSYNCCLNCRTKFETKLKIEGKWEDYLNTAFNAEIDKQIEDYKSYFESILSEGNQNYVSENGEIQKWVGGIDKERAQQSLEEVVKYLNSLKK
jgi:hypothetical protein